jgi:hypothetical protein
MKERLKWGLGVLKESFQQHKFLLYVTYALNRVGVQIVPYYLTLNSYKGDLPIKLAPELRDASCGFLAPSEIEQIYEHPETREFAPIEQDFGQDTFRCFAIKKNREIMSFVWCNLDRSHWAISPFALKQDEAYLFNAYTYRKYRGLNLAPYVRHEMDKALFQMGRTRLLSFTEFLNAPARRYKEKLGCRHLKLACYFKLFSRFHWTINLRDYRL